MQILSNLFSIVKMITDRYRALLFCIFCLLSSLYLLHNRGEYMYGLETFTILRFEPLLNLSNLFFAFSMLIAAYWALSAPSRELLWLWTLLPVLAIVHFCCATLLPFYWLRESKRIYADIGIGYFGYMFFIAVGAHLLHILLRQKYCVQHPNASTKIHES